MNFEKISLYLNWIQFKLGKFFFPILELIFQYIENRDGKVKKHFQQAKISLEKKRVSIAILNLNMILNIKPYHFLSLVFRGKIYLREKRFKLAESDFFKAYKINPYRFIHYGLYNDYNSCVSLGRQKSHGHDFSKAINFFYQQKSKSNNELSQSSKGKSFIPKPAENPWSGSEKHNFNRKEKSKFSEMGPITYKEMRETDWDKLSKSLISRNEEP